MQPVNIREHWDDINTVKSELTPGPDGEVYIISRPKKKIGMVAGRIACVTAHEAALRIAGETHELATPEQIAAWKQEQAQKKAAIESAAAKKDAKFNLDLGPLAEMLLHQQNQNAAPASTKPGKQSNA